MMKDRYQIGKTAITITNPVDAEMRITRAALNGINNYVCVSNMRTVVLAQHDEQYCAVMNNAWMCTPDGTPLTWLAHLWGHKNVQRTSGPDLFMSMLDKPSSGIKHFLLGDTEETLCLIRKKYNHANIVGSYSPPFCAVEDFNYHSIAKLVNDSGAHVVWVSLRAPKQDIFATLLLPYLDKKLCVGVGAAFRFAIGEYEQPHKIIQKLGLTGVFLRKNKKEILLQTIVRFGYLVKFSTQILCARLFRR